MTTLWLDLSPSTQAAIEAEAPHVARHLRRCTPGRQAWVHYPNDLPPWPAIVADVAKAERDGMKRTQAVLYVSRIDQVRIRYVWECLRRARLKKGS